MYQKQGGRSIVGGDALIAPAAEHRIFPDAQHS